MTTLARFAVRRPVLVLVCWAVGVLLLAGIGLGVEGRLKATELFVGGTETDRWREIREGHFGSDAAILLRGPADAVEQQGRPLARALIQRPGTKAISPWASGDEAERLRPDPTRALIPVDLAVPEGEETEVVPSLERFVDERVSEPVAFHTSGLAPLGDEMNEATTSSLRKAELITFPILVLVLLLVFRTPVAAGIPLVIAIGTMQGGFGIVSLINEIAGLDAIALSLVSMIGLALGIDYSLLIVTRFREALDSGDTPRQAASLAANTAGRTAVFAGVVLVGIMLVSFFMSPGTVLLSSAVGSIAATALSMVGAALVTPAAVRLLGHRVNKWQIGRRRESRSVLQGTVGRVMHRPAIAATLVVLALMLVAAPVLAIDTIPPDPRQLPEDSKGLADFRQVRQAGFGPAIDVVVAAPRGAVTDPERLRQISRLERRIARLPYVSAVVGPGVVHERTKDLLETPNAIERAKADLETGRDDLTRLTRGLRQADGGMGELREGLLEASAGAGELADGAQLARNGGAQLADGSGQAADGARALAAGGRQAGDAAPTLLEGLDDAVSGSSRLAGGTRQARSGASELAGGLALLRDGLNGQLAPGTEQLALGLRQGVGQLQGLAGQAQASADQIAAARQTLGAMTVGAGDPLYGQALAQLTAALDSASGLAPALSAAAAQADTGATAAEQVAAGAKEAGAGSTELAAGASALGAGLRRLEGGAVELNEGLREGRQVIAASASGLQRLASGASALADGLGQLDAGAGELAGGLGQLSDGNAQLAGGLSDGHRRSGALERGLGRASGEVADVRMQLLTETGPFRGLRDLETIERESPGFFESGFMVVAALDGAPEVPRRAATFLVDTPNGGIVGRIQIMPDVPTNDPRTEEIVSDVRRVVHDFTDNTGNVAATGGSASQLVDYDRVTSGRLPLLIVAIALVTYLMLVPCLRSLLLPLIAVLLNLVTVAAGFGVLTLLFVGDNPPLGGAGALDVISVTGIFSITFALSIDYQVFLLTRMREEFVRTQSADAAIEFGIAKTAKVVTGAAAIMIAVFTGFALSDFVIIKQFGVGLATAVLIDATIVRLVLLPALMRLFGLRIWWLPDWLDERLPALDVEGTRFAAESELISRAPLRAGAA